MLSNYTAMFTIIISVCTFAAVYSQVISPPYASLSQSTSYSGAGSSSVAYSSATASSSGSLSAFPPVPPVFQQPPLFPPVLPPYVEPFAHSLTQVLLDSSLLNAIGDFVIPDPYTMFYEVSSILLGRDNIKGTRLAEVAADAGKNVGVVTKTLYFNAMTHMLAKVLYLTNNLTQETSPIFPKILLRLVEEYGTKNGVRDPKSVVTAVANGILDFSSYLGINNRLTFTLGVHLFNQEIKALSSGAEI